MKQAQSTGRVGAEVRRNTAGATLLEVLLATVFISTVVIGMALFISKATVSYLHTKSRNFANSAATSTMQELKTRPYMLVALTPSGSYFTPSPTGPCDCNNIDDSQFPSRTLTNGKTIYTVSVCTNLVDHTAGGGWASYCPGTAPDTGLKNVVVSLTWNVDQSTQTVKLGGLLSQNKQRPALGSVNGGSTISHVLFYLCQQAPGSSAPPPYIFTTPQPTPMAACDINGLNNPALVNSEVSMYNPDSSVIVENQGVLPMPSQISLPVPAGNGYSVHIQQVSASKTFFPFHLDQQLNVTPGATYYVYAYMRSTTDFGSKLTGEVFGADHPVISKVMDAYAQPVGCTPSTAPNGGPCDNATEALEIYNPTNTTYQVGCGANPGCVQVQYCNINNVCRGPYDFTGANFTINHSGLSPGAHLLIIGKDTRAGAGIPAEWPQTPDVAYDVGNSALQVP